MKHKFIKLTILIALLIVVSFIKAGPDIATINNGVVLTDNTNTADVISIGSNYGIQTSANNYLIEVARGNISGVSSVNKFGTNSAVSAGATGEDVWEGGGIYAFYPTTPQSIEVVSSSIEDDIVKADTNPGTGAHEIIVYGLDQSWLEINETVTMNGQTAVDLQNTYRRLYRAIVLTVGSGGVNAGNISIRIKSGGTVGAYIPLGEGQTKQAIYTIPGNKTGMFIKGYVGLYSTDKTAETGEFKWKLRLNNGTNGSWQTKGDIGLLNLGSSTWQYQYGVPVGMIPGKTDIRIQSLNNSAEMKTVAGFDLLLFDN